MVKRQANKAARLLKELAEAETHTILSQGGNKWHANSYRQNQNAKLQTKTHI